MWYRCCFVDFLSCDHSDIGRPLMRLFKMFVFQLERTADDHHVWRIRMRTVKQLRLGTVTHMIKVFAEDALVSFTAPSVHPGRRLNGRFNYDMDRDYRVDGPWRDQVASRMCIGFALHRMVGSCVVTVCRISCHYPHRHWRLVIR